MRASVFLLIVMFNLSHFSLAQTGYGGPPESENTRIAREHQYGGAYNPSYGDGSVRSPVWGIIALDTLNLSRSGFAHSEISLEDAKKRALRLCEVEGASCSIVASYTRDTCAVIASTPQGYSTPIWSVEVRSIRKNAEKAALQSCNKKLKDVGIKGEKCKLWFPAKCALPGGS